MISYIQPFEDGNKRTARILGNALLLANNACPLSYRSVNEGDYKKAILLFYEQNNINLFKELFINQFKFSVDNYFL
jgi:Fic family protein